VLLQLLQYWKNYTQIKVGWLKSASQYKGSTN
jgi:hypothetical protein